MRRHEICSRNIAALPVCRDAASVEPLTHPPPDASPYISRTVLHKRHDYAIAHTVAVVAPCRMHRARNPGQQPERVLYAYRRRVHIGGEHADGLHVSRTPVSEHGSWNPGRAGEFFRSLAPDGFQPPRELIPRSLQRLPALRVQVRIQRVAQNPFRTVHVSPPARTRLRAARDIHGASSLLDHVPP
ncbi:MAG: hypothetical protein KatS3mg023_3805 [Armatimonadota bacterium]|nr:MAG: hypothetical protein KatS3mg023_3805 [Armatimonadota bacterium]